MHPPLGTRFLGLPWAMFIWPAPFPSATPQLLAFTGQAQLKSGRQGPPPPPAGTNRECVGEAHNRTYAYIYNTYIHTIYTITHIHAHFHGDTVHVLPCTFVCNETTPHLQGQMIGHIKRARACVCVTPQLLPLTITTVHTHACTRACILLIMDFCIPYNPPCNSR